MTEDDTFRVLTQKPFKEVPAKCKNRIIDMDTEVQADKLLRNYGWTFDEFNRAYNRHFGVTE